MLIVNNSTDSLRSLSQIFSPSNFDKVVRGKDSKLTERKLKKYVSSSSTSTSYKKLISSVYLTLEKEYRSEYFYKNRLITSLFKKYSSKTTRVLNEFKIGSSIADFVFLNGSAKVYEIKTDLDSLDKLRKQLNDYQQFADFVYIVTCSKHVSRILSDYSDSTIGIMEFTKNNRFKIRKEAENNRQNFNHVTIFKTLRKAEYLKIINNYFCHVPNVPNTKIFTACLDLISTVDVVEFQKLAFNILKERKIKCIESWESNKTPFELKQICYTLDFSENEYWDLYKFLKKTI